MRPIFNEKVVKKCALVMVEKSTFAAESKKKKKIAETRIAANVDPNCT